MIGLDVDVILHGGQHQAGADLRRQILAALQRRRGDDLQLEMLEQIQRRADAALIHLRESLVERDQPDGRALGALLDAVKLHERRRNRQVEGRLRLAARCLVHDAAQARLLASGCVGHLNVVAQVVAVIRQPFLILLLGARLRPARQRVVEAVEGGLVLAVELALEERAGAKQLRVRHDQVVKFLRLVGARAGEAILLVAERRQVTERVVDLVQFAPGGGDLLAQRVQHMLAQLVLGFALGALDVGSVPGQVGCQQPLALLAVARFVRVAGVGGKLIGGVVLRAHLGQALRLIGALRFEAPHTALGLVRFVGQVDSLQPLGQHALRRASYRGIASTGRLRLARPLERDALARPLKVALILELAGQQPAQLAQAALFGALARRRRVQPRDLLFECRQTAQIQRLQLRARLFHPLTQWAVIQVCAQALCQAG